MNIIAAIIAFFARLFGVTRNDNNMEPSETDFLVGDSVSYYDPETRLTKRGVITEFLSDLDPQAPYSVKFEGEDGETGTFSASELSKDQ